MITPNKEFFQWIYNRLVNVHKENSNVDYMISFKKRIEELSFDKPHWKPSEEQMMDEWLKDRDVCFWDGVEEGKKAMEKQMMEGAVEGKIIKDIHNLLHVMSDVLPMPSEFKFGDRVKIIILKDDEN
jgi:hypothetical protein